MAGQQRGGKPQSRRGDFTGNQKDKLAQEHAELVAAREGELGLINQSVRDAKDGGVIDLMAGGDGTLQHPDLDPDEVVEVNQRGAQTELRSPDKPNEEGTELLGSGATISVVEMPEEKPRAALVKGSAFTPDTLNEPCMVKALYDLEDITLGYGNTVTLKSGWRYKLPRWAAAHLEEKGLVLVLDLSPV